MLRDALAKGLSLVSILALLLILSAGLASAGTIITFYDWYTPTNGPLPSDPTRNLTLTDWKGLTQSISLPQFDPALGTLNSVTLSFYADADSTGQVTNNSGAAITVNQWDAFLRVRLLVPGVTVPATLLTAYLLEVQPQLVSLTPGTTLNADDTITYPAVSKSSATAAPQTYTTGLGSYIGTGTIDFPLFTNTRTIADLSGGNLDLTQTTLARAEAIVSYDYTPTGIPEPATTVLLGSALVGISLLRFRKR
jgi:hypothetical protein